MTESIPAFDMSEIVALYKGDARKSIEAMKSALASWAEIAGGGPPLQDLRRLAHQLRGSGRTYGFRSVTRICKAVENMMIKLEKRRIPADQRLQASVADKIGRLEALFKE